MHHCSNEPKEEQDKVDDPRRTTEAYVDTYCHWREKEAKDDEEWTGTWTTTTSVTIIPGVIWMSCVGLLSGCGSHFYNLYTTLMAYP